MIVNTGDVALTNATIRDTLPEGLSLVPGSVGLRANDSDTVDALSDEIINNGYNLGTIGTGNTVYVTYKVVAGADFDCTGTELQNNAKLTYDSETETGDTKEDSATVTVKKTDCEEPVVPLDNCETNPALPECQQKTCATDPEMEGCKELPNTGPAEIVIAIVIILGIIGGGYYFYHTKKTLKTVENDVSGHKNTKASNSKESKDEKTAKNNMKKVQTYNKLKTESILSPPFSLTLIS